MKGGNGTAGFTIVETMIVLAVTGVILLGAIIAVQGRTSKTEFVQALTNLQSQIQQVVTYVENGYYPNFDNYQCTNNSGNLDIATGSASEGTNEGCIFIGAILQFNVQGSTPEFITYPVLGLRQDTSGQNTSSYAGANAAVLAPGSNPGSAVGNQIDNQNVPDGTQITQIPDGLTVVQQKCLKNAANTVCQNDIPLCGIGFLTDLNQTSAVAVNGSSGAIPVQLIPFTPYDPVEPSGCPNVVNPSQSSQAAVDAFDTQLEDGTADTYATNPGGGVQVCFKSSTSKQYGLISIGIYNNSQLTVTSKVKDTVNCL